MISESKAKWLEKIIFFYNLLAILLVIFDEFHQFKIEGQPAWGYLLYMAIGLAIQSISTIGLWSEKRWAVIVQFFFYFFQSISVKGGGLNYSCIMGPHFFINLNLNFPDGEVVLGFNVIPIAILILLIMAFVPKAKSFSAKII